MSYGEYDPDDDPKNPPLQEGRQFIGIELKESYFAQATANLRIAHRISNTLEFAEKQEMA